MKKNSCLLLILSVLPMILHAQLISTIGGKGSNGFSGDGGPAISAEFNFPLGIALDNSANIIIADRLNNCIRKIDISTGLVSTVAGTGISGFFGDGGPANSAQLFHPSGVALDNSGNIYIADSENDRIRKVTASTGIISTVAGTGVRRYNGDGIAAIIAELNVPVYVKLDAEGNIYIADDNNMLRKVTASTGLISTIAGTSSVGLSGDGIAATSARISHPWGIAIDSVGNVYFSDRDNNRIRKVTAASGIISTVAGIGGADGYNGDGILATTAQLNSSQGISLDASGNIYLADEGNHRVRKVTASSGIISTIAGTGIEGYNGDGIDPILAQLYFATDVAIDSAGCVYICDGANNRIRKFCQGCQPFLSLSGNTTVCSGNAAILRARGGQVYSWSNGESSGSITSHPIATSSYSVTATNTIGCKDSTNITVIVSPKPTIIAGTDVSICVGSSASLTVSAIPPTVSTFSWRPFDGLSSTATANPMASPSGTSTYYVSAALGDCKNEDTLIVKVNTPALVSASPDCTVNAGAYATLTVSVPVDIANDTYLWSPVFGLNCATCSIVKASPSMSTTYTVTIIDGNGCTSSDLTTIYVDHVCGQLFVPDAFSPNNDNYNDVFYVRADPVCIKQFVFRVFDRWGNQVFESNDIKIGWKGTVSSSGESDLNLSKGSKGLSPSGEGKGDEVNTGIYFYFVKVVYENYSEPFIQKGNVSLVR